MRQGILPLALVVGVLASASAAPAGDGEPATRTAVTAWAEGPGPVLLPARLRVQDDPPAGVPAPPGIGRGAFASVPVPGGPLLLAVDLASDAERTWIDLDLDGDLLDEEPAGWTEEHGRFERRFVLRLTYPGEPEPVAVPFLLFRRRDAERDGLEMLTRIHRTGSVLLGGRVRRLAVVDGEGDGTFDRPGSDLLLVDLDGNGELDPRAGSPDHVAPGAPFRAGSEAWSARVASPSGGRVVFRRLSGVKPPPLRSWPLEPVPPSGTPWASTGKPLDALIGQVSTAKDAALPGIIDDLGRDGTRPAYTALGTLVDPARPSDLRVRAARALGNPAYLPLGSRDRLAAMAAGPDRDVAAAAVAALHAAGAPGREEVYLPLLDSPSDLVAGTAARYLAAIGSEEARKGVLRILAEHPSPTAKRLAWEGARFLESPPPDAVLQGALESPDAEFRAGVILDLVRAGRPEGAAAALRLARPPPSDPRVSADLMDALSLLDGADAAEALVGLAESMAPERVAGLRAMLGRRLSAVRSPPMVEVFVRALRSRAPHVRLLAVEALSGNPEAPVAEALVAAAAREDDPAILGRMGAILSSGGSPAAVALLLNETRRGRVAMQRFAARTLLGMGTEVPGVRGVVLEFLAGRDEQLRLRALESVAASGDASFWPPVLECLTHRSWSVRNAAARTLGVLRVPETLAPLLARIQEEPYRRVREAIGEALYRLTAVNLYGDADLWKRWWEQNGEGFRMPETPPPPVNRDTEVSSARFYGIPVESDHVAFVLDTSGSMARGDAVGRDGTKATRLEVAAAEVVGAAAEMGEGSYVHVVFFGTTVRTWTSGLRRLGSGTVNRLKGDLARTEPEGDTNLFGGLETAFNSADVDTIFLLSDGAPNVGTWVHSRDILQEVDALNEGREVIIHCVSVGESSTLLKEIAARNRGRYVER